jgi:hypothetical protein
MTKGVPRGTKPRKERSEDALKILGHLTKDGSLWDRANCAGTQEPDAWFPNMQYMTNEDLVITEMALRICDRCEIKTECLIVGMEEEELRHGIWGGLLPGERIELKVKNSGRRLWTTERTQIQSARIVRERMKKLNGDV